MSPLFHLISVRANVKIWVWISCNWNGRHGRGGHAVSKWINLNAPFKGISSRDQSPPSYSLHFHYTHWSKDTTTLSKLFFVPPLQGPLHYSDYFVLFDQWWVYSSLEWDDISHKKFQSNNLLEEVRSQVLTITPEQCSMRKPDMRDTPCAVFCSTIGGLKLCLGKWNHKNYWDLFVITIQWVIKHLVSVLLNLKPCQKLFFCFSFNSTTPLISRHTTRFQAMLYFVTISFYVISHWTLQSNTKLNWKFYPCLTSIIYSFVEGQPRG